MSLNVITDNEIRQLPVPMRLFAYADAYLSAAKAVCAQMSTDRAACNWPSGAVVLMLSAHAIELFLKGVLLSRVPALDVWSRGHDLQKLQDDYVTRFAEPEFSWDIPFKTEFPDSVTEAERVELEAQMPKPSIRYRYPVGIGGRDWRGLDGFEPVSFLTVLAQAQSDFRRIRMILAARNQGDSRAEFG